MPRKKPTSKKRTPKKSSKRIVNPNGEKLTTPQKRTAQKEQALKKYGIDVFFTDFKTHPIQYFASQIIKNSNRYKHHYINGRKVSHDAFKYAVQKVNQKLTELGGTTFIRYQYQTAMGSKINFRIPQP